MSPTAEAFAAAVRRCSIVVDTIVREELAAALGTPDFSGVDPVRFARVVSGELETYLLDGEPLATFGPLETKFKGNFVEITQVLKYRRSKGTDQA